MVDLSKILKAGLYLLVLIVFLSQIFNWDNTDTKVELVATKIETTFQIHQGFKDLLEKYKNYCINGKDKSDLTTQQQYEEFLKGPCAPMVILPGILGTSLQLKIDCELLQQNNPSIFSNCGWGTCSRFNLFRKRPAKEYRLWVGEIFSKTNFLQVSEEAKCFGDLIGLIYNSEKNKLEAKDGLEVTWYGNTEQTKSAKNCGADAIKNLSDDLILKKASCSIQGYGNLIELLDKMGYQSGLTYQAVPYDYRQDVAQSDTQQIIPNAINHMHQLSGKKVVILGHSLGNLHILNSLNLIPQEVKDQQIKQFIAAGPPFIGAPKAIINMLGGDPDYLQRVFGKEIGMNFYSQKSFTESCSSSNDILSKDIFEKYQDEEWMKEIIRRIEYENRTTIQESIPLDFLPDPKEKCVNPIFKARKQGQCKSGLINLLEEPILEIDGKRFMATNKDIKQIITDYGIYEVNQTLNLWKKSKEAKGLNELINPNVPTSIIYGNMLETERFFSYRNHTREMYNKTQDFYFPESVINGLGDGTVPTFSALIPGLKWIYEHQKNMTDSKPIKLVEFCSTVKNNKAFYDQIASTGELEMINSEYRGIDCDCSNGGSLDKCYHSCFINDSKFLQFIALSLITHEKSTKTLGKYNSQELDNLIASCPALLHD